MRHTVAQIIAPFGKAIEERPPLLTPEEREAAYAGKRAKKLARQASRTGSEPTIEHGREVMEGGFHQFGKIQDESREGKNRALRRLESARQHEQENEIAEQRSQDEVAKERLEP